MLPEPVAKKRTMATAAMGCLEAIVMMQSCRHRKGGGRSGLLLLRL